MNQVYNRVTQKWLRVEAGTADWVEDRKSASAFKVEKAQFERALLVQQAHARGDRSVTFATLMLVHEDDEPPSPLVSLAAKAEGPSANETAAETEERVALFHPITQHWLTRAEQVSADQWKWHWSPAIVQANLYSPVEAEHMRTEGNMLVLRIVPESELRRQLGTTVEEAKRTQKPVPPQRGKPKYGIVMGTSPEDLAKNVTAILSDGVQLVGGPVFFGGRAYGQAILSTVPQA